MATTTKIQPRALVRASGGPRYAVALAVDALGTGLLRPFLLLYGVMVLRLSAPATGTAMTAGVVVGLVCMPAVGRWLDRGARSTVVAASMLVRVLGVVLLLATPTGNVWLFAAAALFLGIGNQAWPAAHAALVATVAHGRERDAALAGGRALRNAGLGAGALLATASLAGGATALQALAAVTGLAYLAAAALAWSVHVHAHPADVPATDRADGPAPRMRALLAANVIYVFCLNVPEIALPLVLVTQMHASLVWSAAIFVTNTVLVVTLQVPVTVLMSRFPAGPCWLSPAWCSPRPTSASSRPPPWDTAGVPRPSPRCPWSAPSARSSMQAAPPRSSPPSPRPMSWDGPSPASSSPRASASPSPQRSSPLSHPTARLPSGAASLPRRSSPPPPLPPRRIKERGSVVAAAGPEQARELGHRLGDGLK